MPTLDDDASDTSAYGAKARAKTGVVDETLPEGTVIAERYLVGELLGEGGMGSVYFATHLTVGRSVAIKVLAARWCGEDTLAQRFRDEARAASAAGHPNIIEVFDAGELPDGRPYLVMEYLEGRELADVITRHGFLEAERACRIARDVARALDAAHSRGIIHRDLKGENVMLVDRGGEELVKVLDFGIAANNAALGPRATTPGLIMGTPAFMAPEQAKGAPATAAFDIYALGVLLHDSLTGRTPFDESKGVSVLVAKTSRAAPSIATLRDDLPTALVELIDSCLALDPSLRPATAREVAERLLEILEGLRKSGSPSVAHVAPPQRTWLVGGLATVAVLTLCASALALREEPRALEWEAPAAPPPAVVVAKPARAPDEVASSGEPRESSVTPEISPGPQVPTPAVEGALPSIERSEAGEPAPAEPAPAEPSRVARSETSEPATPEVDTALCWRTRKRAEQARDAHDWTGLLRHTRDPSCWAAQREQRRRLRAKGHMELEHWSECVETSRDLRDAEGRKWHELCRRRKEQG